ncbi:response regulator [Caenimonas aquaedulcis]|uniref:Response regulator n=1 Tax=Caenimonas aquaedulcis TaxID=2793270 RepID=A0A931H1W0_9BURK|nr:response regulator [Caenimonas aquaedulcis]MBG9387021.1 response regulator [Caenimonas aquaedulcis]
MSQNQQTESTKVPRILVVDDMPDNLFLMNGLFEDRYDVVQAASGKDALRVLMSANPPDMVLLDIMMPDMDGYEVLRRIRQHPPTANIPVIFLTALATHHDERLGLDLGAVDYLTKPVDPGQVVLRVDAHVRATERSRRIEALSEKLARHLPPQEWQALFHGDGTHGIEFESRQLTVLHAEQGEQRLWNERERESFAAEAEWLAMRHGGHVDHFIDGAAAIWFDDPAACVKMAMELQRSAQDLHVRMGIHTGVGEIGTFRCGFQVASTLVGPATRMAAQVAATAATGSIAVSPETYELVRDSVEADTSGCLLMEEYFHDSDLAQVSLTPAPQKGGHALSTFAGLGIL